MNVFEQALLNTLMGMGTVFAVLILISLVISCFKIFPYLESKKKAGQTENAVKETVQDIPAEQQDNTELIAVIAAAVAACGVSADQIACVRRIDAKSAWTVSSRVEAISVRKECF